MVRSVTPSDDNITKGQAGKFADLFVAALVKSGLPSAQTQLVLEQRGTTLIESFIKLVREQVDAMSKVVKRTISVDRTLSPEAAIAVTGRRRYVTADVVTTMPRGDGDSVTIEFIPLEKWMNDEAVDAKLGEYGLVAVDPFALAAVNAADPDFATTHPCFTHWKDAEGKWCYAAWRDGLDERGVDVLRGRRDWDGVWWAAGVRN